MKKTLKSPLETFNDIHAARVKKFNKVTMLKKVLPKHETDGPTGNTQPNKPYPGLYGKNPATGTDDQVFFDPRGNKTFSPVFQKPVKTPVIVTEPFKNQVQTSKKHGGAIKSKKK